jgi:nucleoside-diphosphate-sugar epimerase
MRLKSAAVKLPEAAPLPIKPQTVVVTGGPGFIGRRVVKRFVERGDNVRSFSLPGEAADQSWSAAVEMIHGDVCRAADVARTMRGAGVVVHLAAVVGVPGEYERQWAIIADGTRNICEAAAANGARAVVASSVAVYGDKIQRQICREDDGFGAWQGAYGRAKQGQETAALEIAEARGVPTTIIRPANVYGLGGTSAWGDRFIAMIAATGGFVIGEGERNNAGLVYVENLADAIVLAATTDAAIGRTYNVCDQEPVTWRQYTDDLARIARKPPPPNVPLEAVRAVALTNEDPARLIGPKDPNAPSLEGLNLVGYDNRFDASRIRQELGWRPRVAYEDAIVEMATTYAAAKSA